MRTHLANPFVFAFLLAASAPTSAFALEAPRHSPDEALPASVTSTISAAVELNLTTIDRELERHIPRRLATFRSRGRECWHRRVLGRMVHIDCAYSGYVQRTGALSLRVAGNRLSAAVPLFGTVTARGTQGLLGLIHGAASGAMTVRVTARPHLRSDWSVGLEMREGFGWTHTPTLHVLGFAIDVRRFVEPQIRKHLGSIEQAAAAHMRSMDIRGKAERAWQHAFSSVQLSDNPELWLQTIPNAVAFSGVYARGHVLEGAIQISGKAQSFVGAPPPAPVATPLPKLGHEVSERGRFDIIVPVAVDYAAVSQQFREAINARWQNAPARVRDVSVYPSDGKLVVALALTPAADSVGSGGDRTIYLTARPRVNADGHVIDFPDLEELGAAIGAGSPDSPPVIDPAVVQALRQDVRVLYRDTYEKIVAAANTKLSRSLGDGFRSEGKLTSIGLERVLLLDGGLRVDLRASGSLKLLYGF